MIGYTGGGNAARLDLKVGENVIIITNIAGIHGDARLWQLCDASLSPLRPLYEGP